MPKSSSRPTADPSLDTPGGRVPEPGAATPTPAATAALGSLSDLPVAGLTRRRMALLIGALVAAWVIVLFARQVGEASEATARADDMRAANVALQVEVTALEDELQLIQRQAYIEQQARQYRLGTPREIPFVLADDAPPLAADAPGTAAVRLGAVADRRSPLESWLRILLGPGDDPAAIQAPAPGS
jgi:cell division protein FtsB